MTLECFESPLIDTVNAPIGYCFDGVSYVGYHYYSSSDIIYNDTGIRAPDQVPSLQDIFDKDLFFISPFQKDWIPYHLQSRIQRLGSLAELRFSVNKSVEVFNHRDYLRLFKSAEASDGSAIYYGTNALNELITDGIDFVYYAGACRRGEIPEGILIYPRNSVNALRVFDQLPARPYTFCHF